MTRFYTIGHSNRSIKALLTLLAGSGVTIVADVRTSPRSRHNPQFDAEPFAHALQAAGIGYRHLPALGGLRGKQKDATSANDFWENERFRNYADYAATAPFRQALEELRALGRGGTCAILCAEAVWWQCHRRIIADYLLAAGEEVIHILGEGRTEPARLTETAVIGSGGTIAYPAAQGSFNLL